MSTPELTASEIAIRRARVADDLETLELPVDLEDRPYTARGMTTSEFLDVVEESAKDRVLPPPDPVTSNTTAAMTILGMVSRQGVYALDEHLKPRIVDGIRIYDLAVVRAYARTMRQRHDELRLADAAARVGVASQTLARWTREARITAIERSQGRVYRVADLDALAARLRVA